MSLQLFEYEENPRKTLHDDSDTDDDVSECFNDDEDNDSTDEEEGRTNVKTLEWDDSTLSYWRAWKLKKKEKEDRQWNKKAEEL